MQTPPPVIVATRNPHKTAEIRAMLDGVCDVLDVTDFPACPDVAETGNTFLDNARLKALAVSRHVPGWVLSDDSGLEVDALGGAPGVTSSSFGGEEGNHARNNARLIAEMRGRSLRSARFRCTMVLARDGREEAHFSGTVEGRILDELRGTGGFGYDPLFIPDGFDQTFGELAPATKNLLSHRARALAQVTEYLKSRTAK